jgi:integrase
LQQAIEKENPQLWMACCFIYYTAIRPGTELRLMQLKQINFQSRVITVTNTLAKNNRTETIDIPSQLYDMIVNKWNLQDYDPELYVFGPYGRPGTRYLGENTMRERFNKYRRQLNLPREIQYYSWKHSGAQELSDKGISTYELQRHLRHESITTTEQYLKKRIGQKSSRIKCDFPSI